MTIAIISMIRDSWGGSEELWAAMAEEAIKQNHTVVHLSYQFKPLHPKMQSLIDKGLINYSRPSYKPSFQNPLLVLFDKVLFFYKKRSNSAFKNIFKLNPDIVLYNGTCYSIAEERKLLTYWGKPGIDFFILGHFNNDNGGNLSIFAEERIKHAYGKSKKVFFVAQRSIQTAERELNTGMPNAVIVRNPVNIASTNIIPWPQIEKLQFAMVGNLIMVHKGQDITLNVLSLEKWKQRNWHLNIYGSGEDEGSLIKMIESLQLADHITLHGRVTDIQAVWRTNHILLMPSRMEGMPLAVVEAMMCGRPIVATDVGGHKEWIDDGQEGFIAEKITVASFGSAMERAWAKKADWEDMGRKAHSKAMQLYDPQPGKTLLHLLTS
jgi:glycosyltransferase involved in cell wall biosynthesis